VNDKIKKTFGFILFVAGASIVSSIFVEIYIWLLGLIGQELTASKVLTIVTTCAIILGIKKAS